MADRPWRVESHIDEPGEPWKLKATYATEQAAVTAAELFASTYHQTDFRVTNRDDTDQEPTRG